MAVAICVCTIDGWLPPLVVRCAKCCSSSALVVRVGLCGAWVVCRGDIRGSRVTHVTCAQVQYSAKLHETARAAMKGVVDYMNRTTAQLRREVRACVRYAGLDMSRVSVPVCSGICVKWVAVFVLRNLRYLVYFVTDVATELCLRVAVPMLGNLSEARKRLRLNSWHPSRSTRSTPSLT